MLSVVTFSWGQNYRFSDVLRLKDALAQYLTVPHRLIPITATGKESGAIAQADLERAAGHKGHPYCCLRRLPLLSAAMGDLIGERILHLDLDLAIVGNIDHLVTDHDLRIYRCPSIGPRGYAYGPGLLLMRAGVLDHLWQKVKKNPVHAMIQARRQGWTGCDQSIISAAIDPHQDVYTEADGVYSWRDHARHGQPEGACMIQYYGKDKSAWQRSSSISA